MNGAVNDTVLDLNKFLQRNLISTDLAVAAAEIAYHNFEWRYVTMVLLNSTLMVSVATFVQLYSKSVMINTGVPYSASDETRQYIIMGKDIENIDNLFQWMIRQRFDNTGRYIVVCTSRENIGCDETRAVQLLWRLKITNVVYLKNSLKEGVTGYTYKYYQNDNCDKSDPIRLKNVDSCIRSRIEQECQMFVEETLNLNRCPLIVSTFIQPPYMEIQPDGKPVGIDGDLLIIIAQGLNASIKMMTPRYGDGWGALDENGDWIGSLRDLYDDVANFSMTFPAITPSRIASFQMSVDYNFVSVVWVTSPPELQPSSLKLLQPFRPVTHIAVATIFIILVLFAAFTKTHYWTELCRMMNINRPRNSVLFYSWMICMGLSTKQLPRKPVFLYVVFIWIWYCFLIRTFYQASLINSLKRDLYYSNLDTIEELLDANYEFGGGSALRDYYVDYPLIYNKYINLNTSEIKSNMLQISKGKKFVLAANLQHVNLFLKNSEEKLFILPQKIVVSPTVVFFKKFSPLASSVNIILRRLIETGFCDKLYKNHAYVSTMNVREDDNRKPLNTNHYKGCYAILVTGWILSGVLFFAEVLLGHSKMVR